MLLMEFVVYALIDIFIISKMVNVNLFVQLLKFIQKLLVFVFVLMVYIELMVNVVNANLGKFIIKDFNHVILNVDLTKITHILIIDVFVLQVTI